MSEEFSSVLSELERIGVVGDIDLSTSVPEDADPVLKKLIGHNTPPTLEVDAQEEFEGEPDPVPDEEAEIVEEQEKKLSTAELCEKAVYGLDALSRVAESLRDLFADLRESLTEEE